VRIDEITERRNELRSQLDNVTPETDLDAIEEEIRSLDAEEAEIRKAAAEAEETRKNVAPEVVAEITNHEKENRNMFGIETVEYRNAWVKNLIKREMSAEERSALSSAGAVIPTMTVNAVWDRLVKPAELLGKVDVSQFPSYVRFPRATSVGDATAQAVGGTVTESSDTIGYVDLTPNEYIKLLTVGADIDHMAIDAIHDWIVDNLTRSIRWAINKDILVGTGSNALKGISASVNASATALTPDAITKADLLGIMAALGSQYQDEAIWVMSPEMFYTEVMGLTTLNDYVVNNGFEKKLFGHDVVLMSEAVISSCETIFYGDPKAYKVNIFKALDVKQFETATTTNLQFRGVTMVDGELLDTSAFVRFART
jgi:HK97 family phage major capsid protein